MGKETEVDKVRKLRRLPKATEGVLGELRLRWGQSSASSSVLVALQLREKYMPFKYLHFANSGRNNANEC